MECQHLLRVMAPPTTIAKEFATYCRRNNVVTRGLCKIGFITRRPPSSTIPQSSSGILPPLAPEQCRLRGLIANKDLKKGENVVMLPERACLHPGRALRCEPFVRLLPQEWRSALEKKNPERLLLNERLMPGSLIWHHQLLVALYMAFIMAGYQLKADWMARDVPGSDAIHYLNFLPRDEGNFYALSVHLMKWLDAAPIIRESEGALAKQLSVTQAEIRPLLLYALTMVFSRMVPVDHKGLLEASFRKTELEGWFSLPQDGEPSASGSQSPGETPPTTDGSAAPAIVPEVKEGFVKHPISFLCPIIDMCNHSASENVAVMVPATAPASAASGPIVCLRTLRDIAKGEELTMSYTTQLNELQVIWGMTSILE